MTDGCRNFRKFLIEGTKPNLKKIKEYVDRSLMLVTALSPVIGYDKASKIAHYAMDNDLTLKAAALKLGFVTEELFDRIVDPAKMVNPLRSRKIDIAATFETHTRGIFGRMRVFRVGFWRIANIEDWLAERRGFEPAVPSA